MVMFPCLFLPTDHTPAVGLALSLSMFLPITWSQTTVSIGNYALTYTNLQCPTV